MFAVHFKTVEKRGIKENLDSRSLAAAAAPFSPGGSGEERGRPLVGGGRAAGRTGRAPSVPSAAGWQVAAPQRRGAVCSGRCRCVDCTCGHGQYKSQLENGASNCTAPWFLCTISDHHIQRCWILLNITLVMKKEEKILLYSCVFPTW